MSIPEPVCKISDLDRPDFFDDEAAELVHAIDECPVDKTGKDFFESNFTDLLICAKVMLLHGEELQSGKVKGKTILMEI